MMTKFVNFLVDGWLWNMMYATEHVIATIGIMTLLLRVIMHHRFWYAIAISVAVCMLSFFIYAGIMYLLVTFNMTSPIMPSEQKQLLFNPFISCLQLATVYTFLQIIIFIVVSLRALRQVPWYTVICSISNGIAASITYIIIRMSMWYHF